MATDTRNLPAFLDTDATFRTWGSGLAAQLAATGLVQTADTGQINWTTVTRPAVVSTYAGYEIWRFNDSLQATRPVFIKIEYGVGSPVDRPAVRVQVCTATNGAGTPAGQIGTQFAVSAAASKTAGVTLPSYCSGSTSRLNLCTNLDAAASSFSMLLFIERTKTSAGADTGDGVATFLHYPFNSQYQVIPASGSIPAAANRNLALSLTGGVSTIGSYVALSPTLAPLGKLLFASWCAYLHADFGELIPVQADHLGAAHTMLPLGDGVPPGSTFGLVQGTVTGHSLAILWE